MSPLELLRETREKARRSHAPRGASADVGEIREVAFELVLVVVPQRKMPGTVVCRLPGGQQFLSQRIVVGKKTACDVAERDDARACQGRDVDHCLRLKTLGIGQCIAQDEPSFGIRIEDFYGLS